MKKHFIFLFMSGLLFSSMAALSLNILAVNDVPQAWDRNVFSNMTETVSIQLFATDGDGDPLQYRIITPPAYGSLDTTQLPLVVYTPDSEHPENTSFTFQASDGTQESNLGTIKLGKTVVGLPAAMQNVQGTVAGDGSTPQINLKWEPEANASQYLLFYNINYSGYPYIGQGLEQGNSPLTLSGLQSQIILTGIPPEAKLLYIRMVGVNDYEEQGPMGTELAIAIPASKSEK